jgi:hypothetical protein
MSHTEISPSNAHRWLECPGSVRLCEGIESKGSYAAIEGTHTHTLLEMCIKSNNDPKNMIGVTLFDHEGFFVVDIDRSDRVRVALDYIRSRPGVVTSERKVDIGDWYE